MRYSLLHFTVLFLGYTHSHTSPSSGSFTTPENTKPFFSKILVEKFFSDNVRAVIVTFGSVLKARSTRSLQISVPTPFCRYGSNVPYAISMLPFRGAPLNAAQPINKSPCCT